MALTSSLAQVLKFLRKNNRVDQLDKNYTSKIAEETGLCRDTVAKCLTFLEQQDLVEKRREGKKKVIVPQDESPI